MTSYQTYLRSEHWKITRRRRLGFGMRYDRHILCEDCRMLVPMQIVEVHHKTYERIGRELMEDLSILCEGCHASTHGKPTPRWWDQLRDRHNTWTTEQFKLEVQRLVFYDRMEVEEAIYVALRSLAYFVDVVDINPRPIGEIIERLFYQRYEAIR